MLISSIKIQMSHIFRSKSSVFVALALLFVISVNFLQNMNRNIDSVYVTEMFDITKTLTLSDWSPVGYFFMQYYPLLIVIPTAGAYICDLNNGIDLYMRSRIGIRNYLYGKVISVFLVTLILFTIPFLIEIMLSAVCFSTQSLGDPSGFEYFQTIEQDGKYFLANIYLNNRIIYAVIMSLLFGMVSAILATFNFTITMLPIFKFKIMTYFPIYLLFYIISIFEKVVHLKFATYYAFILRMFEVSTKKNYLVYIIFLLVLLAISIMITEIKIRKNSI